MASKAAKKETPGTRGTKKITFKCKFCEKSKPLDEMKILTRFFPPIVACRDCEKKMR